MNEAGNKQKNEKNLNKQFCWNGVILEKRSGDDDRRLARSSIVPISDHLYLLSTLL